MSKIYKFSPIDDTDTLLASAAYIVEELGALSEQLTGTSLPMGSIKIFAMGFTASYQGGEIQLGSHHDKYQWVALDTFEPVKYFQKGWETGMNRYMQEALSRDGSQ